MKTGSAYIVIAAALLCFLAGDARSSALTLDECIDLALQNRASIIAARGQEDLARAGRRAALGAFLPRVSASYSYSKSYRRDVKSESMQPTEGFYYVDTMTFVDGRSGQTVNWEFVRDSTLSSEIVTVEQDDQDGTSKNWGAQASMSLFDLSNWFELAAAGAEKARAHLDVISSEQDLVYSVKLAYYAYLAAVENVAVQEEAVRRSEEQLKLIQSKFDLGSAAKSDVLKQKVGYGNDRLALLSAQNLVISTKADLAYTIGVDPNRDVQFSTVYNSRGYSGSLEEAIEFGLEHHPGILGAAKDVDAAGHSLRAAKAGYLPTLGASASIGWSDGTQGDTVIYDFSSRSSSIGLSASWNIFDGFQREQSISYAKINRNNARAQESETRNYVVAEIKKAYLNIDMTKEQREVSQENVDAATEDLKISREKYNLGAATILDLLTAQESLRSAQVSLVQAEFDLNLAIARLENAMGKVL